MTKPTRILQVFSSMNRGGAETMLMNLYRNIDRNKIQFDFIVHTEARCSFDEEIKQLGGKIYRVPRYNGRNHLLYVNEWKKIMRNHKGYKIVHGHVRSTASIYLKICKNNGMITISHSHSTSSGVGVSSMVKNIMQYPIRNIADYFFACSKPSGKWLFGEKIVDSNNFYILNNAIDAKKFTFNNNKIRNKTRKKMDIENKYVIGHIGSFSLPKNHDFIIDIFKNIKIKNNNSILLLVGDGDFKKQIEEKVKINKLEDSVIFTGVSSDIPELLHSMDVFLFPSLYEGLPVTLIEAQASGLPCVISDAITKEVKIINDVEFISLDESIEYWTKRVLKYESIYERENTYEEICKAGYNVKKNAKWLEDFYFNI